MELILLSVGLIGLLIFAPMIVRNAVDKKPKKKAVIGFIVCIILIFIGLSMPIDTN